MSEARAASISSPHSLQMGWRLIFSWRAGLLLWYPCSYGSLLRAKRYAISEPVGNALLPHINRNSPGFVRTASPRPRQSVGLSCLHAFCLWVRCETATQHAKHAVDSLSLFGKCGNCWQLLSEPCEPPGCLGQMIVVNLVYCWATSARIGDRRVWSDNNLWVPLWTVLKGALAAV